MFDLPITITAIVADVSEANIVEEIFTSFKIDWPYFIAQCISFALVVLILKLFAFNPILAMLEERKSRIAEGEDKLKRIEDQLAETDARTQKALDEANEKAQQLVSEAKESSQVLADQKSREAIVAAKQIIERAEEAAKQLREKEVEQLRKEFGRLVVATTCQVTGKELTEADQQRLNQEAMSKLDA